MALCQGFCMPISGLYNNGGGGIERADLGIWHLCPDLFEHLGVEGSGLGDIACGQPEDYPQVYFAAGGTTEDNLRGGSLEDAGNRGNGGQELLLSAGGALSARVGYGD